MANFFTLVKQGFYNGSPFHRVLPKFMAQGGAKDEEGQGGPGYTIRCECYRPDYRRHFRGTLSMAHAGRDTGNSQFFLTFIPTAHLNGKHTAFGRVIEGMEVLADIQRRSTHASDESAKGRPHSQGRSAPRPRPRVQIREAAGSLARFRFHVANRCDKTIQAWGIKPAMPSPALWSFEFRTTRRKRRA